MRAIALIESLLQQEPLPGTSLTEMQEAAREMVEFLLDQEPVGEDPVCEASVHRSTRSRVYMASFTGPAGGQIWKSTGLRDRESALALAQRWEADAKRKRAAQGAVPRKPTNRVRPGSVEAEMGLFSQREVALILRVSERAVRQIERRAIDKLRRHPDLKDFWSEWLNGEIKETALSALGQWILSRAEVAAVYGLAQTPEERQALTKLFALTQGARP